jgi:hypothetical protein
MREPLVFKVRDCDYGDAYGIAIREGDSRRFISPVALELKERAYGEYIEPAFSFRPEEMQSLFNEMWALGFRPKDGTGNSGHLAAIEYHLEDMRRLVFKEKKNA